MMVYVITEFKPTGKNVRALTLAELKAFAKEGDRRAIKELVDLKGGWASLTAAQKEKITQLLLGYGVEL